MMRKNIWLAALVVLFTCPIYMGYGRAETFYHQDRINEGISAFFLIDLEKNDDLKVELEPDSEGNFTLFLSDERPQQTYVRTDQTFDDEIFEKAEVYDLSKTPELNYTAKEEKIFYIQIVLIENGPDYYSLEANKELVRYYLPQVPGYPIEFILISSLLIIGAIVYLVHTKMIRRS